MTDFLLFGVVALRAIVELLVWLIIGRAVLRLIAGKAASGNPIVRIFDVVLNPPRVLAGHLWPATGAVGREWLLFGLLVLLWLGLGLGKGWLQSSNALVRISLLQ